MKMPKYMVFHVSHFGGTAGERPWCIGVRVDEHQDKLSVCYKPFKNPFLFGLSRFGTVKEAQIQVDHLNRWHDRSELKE